VNFELEKDSPDLVITRAQSGGQVRAVQRACLAGRYIRIAAGVYLRACDIQRQAALVRQDWLKVAAALVPGGVVSYRSAFGPQLDPAGFLVLSHPTRFNRSIQVPGLRISLVRGPAALPGDAPLADGALHRSSVPRMLLENLGRPRGEAGRVAGEPAVRQRLVSILDTDGPGELHAIRARAAQLAPLGGFEKPFAKLAALVDQLAGPPIAAFYVGADDAPAAAETGADASCMALLRALAKRLRAAALPSCAARAAREPARAHLAFIEAYFDSSASAYGVSIEQARDAVFSGSPFAAGEPPPSALAGELMAGFNLARHSPLCDTVPPFGPGFAPSLRARHEMLMKTSPQSEPGRFRVRAIHPDRGIADAALIRATLAAGSQLALTIPEGLARAVFYSILLWRVQPFEHGGERLARLVMNAELASVGQARILLPPCLRQRFVDLRERFRTGQGPDDYVRLLESLQRWSAALDATRLDALIESIRRCGALQFRCSEAEAAALLTQG
jgi:hypothetical protein